MAISINPVLPVLATQETGAIVPELQLQPGVVVDALVLKILTADLVRIAIANVSIDVHSEIPLQTGQQLRLAVSQTEGGIRLAVVGQNVGQGTAGAGSSDDAVTLSPQAQLDIASSRPTITAPPKNALTLLEHYVVSAAAQSAATEQESLAPLFANLTAAASSGSLPPKLQQAVAQVLAQQTSLDPNLAGSDIKNAFQKSGLFLEASLASGSVPASGAVPDLKAALIVLRQTLQSALGTAAAVPAPPAAQTAQTATPVAVRLVLPQISATPSLAPSAFSEFDGQEIQLSQVPPPVTDNILVPAAVGRSALAAALDAGPSAGATLNMLQEALQALGGPVRAAATANAAPGLPKDFRNDDVTVHTSTPPPFRGALPTAQPVASPSIAPDTPPSTMVHRILHETDAAIARQTLLQVASLPDRVDSPHHQIDLTAPRWNFEIPFATPQGTAMAQFEISRDGGGQQVEAAKRVWRARFSIDVEPAGPIHALVSLSGEKTSVRMWAERPATAAQLRAGAAQLSQALSRAELQPGDIVIGDGTPPQPVPPRAGHFMDRAL